MHILRMKKGTHIPHHKDAIDKDLASQGYKSHHRLNIVMNTNFGGGRFGIDGKEIGFHDRIFKFRPDKQTHWVTPVLFGTRYVLSIGWLSKHAN